MAGVVNLSYQQLLQRATRLPIKGTKLYGVPNGGIYAGFLACAAYGRSVEMVETPEEADTIVDDVIDSGATRERYSVYNKPFVALVDKTGADRDLMGTWVSFCWERMANQTGPEDAVIRILQFLGEDPAREGLRETPTRVVRSWGELFAGYKQDPAALLKTFEDGACDEMVVLKDIGFTSFCEHHLLPFTGTAHVAYLPDRKVLGLSKLARLVDCFAKRLQLQERLTTQVTAALDEHLRPQGSACVVEATHYCMACRGVRKENAVMVTSSLTGVFRDKPEVRAEFFQLVRG